MPKPAEPQDLSGLSPWADELAKTFVSLASDIALVLDESGVITNIAQSGAAPVAPAPSQWVGRPLVDTVSADTRRKIESLLQEVNDTGLARRREVSHPSAGGGIPVAYTAVRLGQHGPVLAVGRDLRVIAAIQQRFIDSQQELERGYWQARRAESLALTLKQVARDAVLVVDAESLTIVNANDAGARLCGREPPALAGQAFGTMFEPHSRGSVEALLASARGSGRPSEVHARLVGQPGATSVSAIPFRSGDEQRLLVRLRSDEAGASGRWVTPSSGDDAAEAAVITDSSGCILAGSPAFVRLAGGRADLDLRGRELVDCFATAADGFEALVGQVRRDGIGAGVLPVATRPGVNVRVDAALLTEGDRECIGFNIGLAPPFAPGMSPDDAFVDAMAALDRRLGSTSMAALLREATRLAARHFVDLALERCEGDADAAARLLDMNPEGVRRRSRRVPRRKPGARVR